MKYSETKIYSKKRYKSNYFNDGPAFLRNFNCRTFFLILLFLLLLSLFLMVLINKKAMIIQEQKVYGVAIGDFATESTANYYATVCQARGGAGGVYKDGDKYLLFVAVYSILSDAESVSNNLLQEGERAYVYQWRLPEIKLKFKGGSTNVAMAMGVTEIFWTTFSSVLSIALALDKDLKGISEVSEEIENLKEQTDEAIITSEKIKTKETESFFKEILVGLAYQKTVLSQLEKNNLKKVDLKIAYFDLLLLNISIRDKLSQLL